jgi:hypothetical protein
MIDNPIHQKAQQYKKYNVTLVCRIFEGKESIKEFRNIQDLCKQNSISFLGREYNSRIYNEDCEYITRLPAFHIYKNSVYVGTFYEGENFFQIIESDSIESDNVERTGFFKKILKILKISR